MKRFTETGKWMDPWFRRLSPAAKLLWQYLCDNCDRIGVADLDYRLVSMDFGLPVTGENLAELGDRVQELDGGKVFIPKFIRFQYGQLSAECPAHKKVIQDAALHRLEMVALDYHYPNGEVKGQVFSRETEEVSEWHVQFGVNLPERFQNAKTLSHVQRWLRHKKDLKQGYRKDALSVALAKWAEEYTVEQFSEAVRSSIANNNQWLFRPGQKSKEEKEYTPNLG